MNRLLIKMVLGDHAHLQSQNSEAMAWRLHVQGPCLHWAQWGQTLSLKRQWHQRSIREHQETWQRKVWRFVLCPGRYKWHRRPGTEGSPCLMSWWTGKINTLVMRNWRTEEHFKVTRNSLIFCEFPFTKSSEIFGRTHIRNVYFIKVQLR